jgi:hypothetical protein
VKHTQLQSTQLQNTQVQTHSRRQEHISPQHRHTDTTATHTPQDNCLLPRASRRKKTQKTIIQLPEGPEPATAKYVPRPPGVWLSTDVLKQRKYSSTTAQMSAQPPPQRQRQHKPCQRQPCPPATRYRLSRTATSAYPEVAAPPAPPRALRQSSKSVTVDPEGKF